MTNSEPKGWKYLPGDRKNSDAPLIVGTTEIFRNQLFDALRGGNEVRADLVVLDEAHYLADEDRGNFWEEAIILTPARIRLLFPPSATIGNAEEFAGWIEEVRGVRCGLVSRPGAPGRYHFAQHSCCLISDCCLYSTMPGN